MSKEAYLQLEKKHMKESSFDRGLVAACSGIQSLVFIILLHSIMSNSLPVGLGQSLALGSGIGSAVAFLNLTLCSVFGTNDKILKVCRFTALVPLIIFGALFVIGAVNDQ
ncbi:MAG: hypothetical protein KDA87_25500 [Planctomycetales bacterium]|nr:hypothetical protein [Planctomycetales bacterium]